MKTLRSWEARRTQVASARGAKASRIIGSTTKIQDLCVKGKGSQQDQRQGTYQLTLSVMLLFLTLEFDQDWALSIVTSGSAVLQVAAARVLVVLCKK